MNAPQRQMTWDEVVAQMVIYRNERDALAEQNKKLQSLLDANIAQKRCEPCRSTGAVHCSDPENCGGPWDKHPRPNAA